MTDRSTDPAVPAGPPTVASGAVVPPTVAPPAGAASDVAAPSGPAAGASRAGWSARRQLLLLLLGIGAVVLASMAGGTGVLGRILERPFPVGLLLAAASMLLGCVGVLRAASRSGGAREDARELIRAVRLIFLAVGCFAAAAGWVIGSPVPIVAGLIIVGIDVIETTFLLLVTASRETDPGTPSAGG